MNEQKNHVIKGDAILNYRLLVLKKGLQLEIKTGMQLTRGPSAYTIIKKEFGLKGNKKNVLKQFEQLLSERG